jgi:hypothetical protein
VGFSRRSPPFIPNWPGIFSGELLHSSRYRHPAPHAHKRGLLEARVPLGVIAPPGAPVPLRCAAARAHTEWGHAAPIVDPGEVRADMSCVAVAIPLGGNAAAAVSVLVPGPRPPFGLLAATRATGARIASLLRAP